MGAVRRPNSCSRENGARTGLGLGTGAYVGQGLFVLQKKELVALFRAGVFQDKGEMLDLPQGQPILEGHHHILAREEERS